MQNNFLEYLQKNGVEAFDKMAADLAKQLNDAKAQFEADQKKKAEEEVAKQKAAENRKVVAQSIGRTLKMYYGDKLADDPTELAEVMLKAIDKVAIADQKKSSFESKMEVVKDEDIPGGHVKVMRGDLSDLSDEELRDFWNGFTDFFKID